MARTVLRQEITDRVVELINAGNTDAVCAVLSGISYSTFRQWMTKGEQGRKPYVEFFEAVEHAKATIECRMVEAGYSPACPDAESARAWLAKRRPDWRESKQLEVTGETVTRVRCIVPGMEVDVDDDED